MSAPALIHVYKESNKYLVGHYIWDIENLTFTFNNLLLFWKIGVTLTKLIDNRAFAPGAHDVQRVGILLNSDEISVPFRKLHNSTNPKSQAVQERLVYLS